MIIFQKIPKGSKRRDLGGVLLFPSGDDGRLGPALSEEPSQTLLMLEES
jgi:hypothetical protein